MTHFPIEPIACVCSSPLWKCVSCASCGSWAGASMSTVRGCYAVRQGAAEGRNLASVGGSPQAAVASPDVGRRRSSLAIHLSLAQADTGAAQTPGSSHGREAVRTEGCRQRSPCAALAGPHRPRTRRWRSSVLGRDWDRSLWVSTRDRRCWLSPWSRADGVAGLGTDYPRSMLYDDC